jgi:ATP-dependent helicase/nuclease subunit A
VRPASRCCARPRRAANRLCRSRPGGLHRGRADRPARAPGEDGLPTDAALAVSDGIATCWSTSFRTPAAASTSCSPASSPPGPSARAAPALWSATPCSRSTSSATPTPNSFRASRLGLEIPHDEPLLFRLCSPHGQLPHRAWAGRAAQSAFAQIFADDDGSGVTFSSAQPAREETASAGPPFTLHLDFVPQTGRGIRRSRGRARKRSRPRQADRRNRRSDSQPQEPHRAARAGKRRKIPHRHSGPRQKAPCPIAAGSARGRNPLSAPSNWKSSRPAPRCWTRSPWPAPCSIRRIAWPGWAFCALPGAASRSTTCTRWPARRSCSPAPCRSCWPSGCRCSASRAARRRARARALARPRCAPPSPRHRWEAGSKQVWLLLGGAACVDATARANLNLLWSCLDRLPGGERICSAPAWNAALDKLTALPDPAASSDCGVQLMTIHKSKGLEFEVVIVPELQAANGARRRKCFPGWSAASPSPANRERSPSS